MGFGSQKIISKRERYDTQFRVGMFIIFLNGIAFQKIYLQIERTTMFRGS